jgi:hypothetical protein
MAAVIEAVIHFFSTHRRILQIRRPRLPASSRIAD